MKRTPEISSSPTPPVSAVCQDTFPCIKSVAFSAVTVAVKAAIAGDRAARYRLATTIGCDSSSRR